MKKRFLSMILMIALLLSVIVSADASAANGDVDNDGDVESIDVTLIQRHLASVLTLDEAAQQRGCVSGGSALSIVDATLIQRYLAKAIDRFPAQDMVTFHFTDNKKWKTIHAYLYNYATGEALAEWPGVELTDPVVNDSGYNEYSLTVNVGKYDRVIFNSGSKQTTATPITKASTGYNINTRSGTKYIAGVFPYENNGTGTLETITLPYPSGYDKTVYIWLPEGYDPQDTDKQYSTLYMSDGHNLFDKLYSFAGTEWQCDESVLSLMSNGGDGVIIVGIDNSDDKRVTELTPDIEGLNPEMVAAIDEEIPFFQGDVFAGFVVNDLIPYVESHYNVNDVRGFAGSSCGGQMAFYIGLEYPETFDYIGAFSSAVAYFTEEAWDAYLSTKDFSGDVPRMYLYTGTNEKDSTEAWIWPSAVLMEGWLLDHGYPADKLVNVVDPDGLHHERYWALYFPELLCWGLDL